jgi:hypothetical protein
VRFSGSFIPFSRYILIPSVCQMMQLCQEPTIPKDCKVRYTTFIVYLIEPIFDGFATVLTEFAQLCLQPVDKKTASYEDMEWFQGCANDRVTEVEVLGVPVEDDSGNKVSVRFLMLPSDRTWPSFVDRKQHNAAGQSVVLLTRNIIYPELPQTGNAVAPSVVSDKDGEGVEGVDKRDGRLDAMNVYRHDSVPTIAATRLLAGHNVVFSGHPGVGKSVEVNIVLLYLLQYLVNRPEISQADEFHVYLRIDRELFRYSVANHVIHCDAIAGAGEDLQRLEEYINQFRAIGETSPRNKILILELVETEANPNISAIPTLLALSSRDVMSLLSTMKKSGGLEVVIRPPHSPEALIALAKALYQRNAAAFAINFQRQADSAVPITVPVLKLDTVLAAVRARIKIVGPLAREVLNQAVDFIEWRDAMKYPMTAKNFLNDLENLSAYRLSRDTKYFVAPYSRYSVRFLSQPSYEMVRQQVETESATKLTAHGLDGQIAENTVIEYFIMKRESLSLPSMFWDCHNWEYFHNPESGKPLTSTDAVDDVTKEQIIRSAGNHTRRVYFSHSWIPLQANQLDEKAVYLSTMATMPVGECLTYDKANNRITLYQTSTVDPHRQPFMINSLLRYSQNGKVNIRILYFVPWHTKPTNGIRIIEPGSRIGEVTTLTDAQVIRLLYKNGPGEYSSFIVRYDMYCNNSMPPYLLQTMSR